MLSSMQKYHCITVDQNSQNGQSGNLVLSNVEETFDDYWIANTYEVEITPKTNLDSGSQEDDLAFSFSDSIDGNKPQLNSFNDTSISGTANYTGQDEIIVLTVQGKSIRGQQGIDHYLVSELIPQNSKISITDTEGVNVIEIPDNTFIDKVLFTKNATRITLSNNKEITINKADKFTYKLGSNVTTGVKSEDLSYTEFASYFGVEDILDLSGSTTGTITDQYII